MRTSEAQDKKVKSITVVGRSSDPQTFRAQKGNKVTFLRKTAPEPQLLTPLATFLVEHLGNCVAGETGGQLFKRVLLYGTKTEADVLRERKPCHCTEDIISRHMLGQKLAQIGEWQFLPIEPCQSDAEYWNTQASRILAAGVSSIVIGQTTMRLIP